MLEVLNHNKEKIEKSKILKQMDLRSKEFFLISCHREENVDISSRLQKLINLINYLGDELNKKVIFSTHPRTRKKIEESSLEISDNAHLAKPLNFTDYVRLQQDALVVFSDSGTITEETSILNLRSLNIRDSHERPEGMEEGSVMLTGLNLGTIRQGIRLLESNDDSVEKFKIVEDYNIDNVSNKVVRIILSHIDFVNRVVWKKYED